MPSRFNALSWSRVGWVSIVFSSVEVTGATDVGVRNRRPVRGRGGPFGFEVVFPDRVGGGEGARPDLQGPAAGCLQPVAAIALDQTDDADRGPESLLRVRALAHDGLDQHGGIAPDLAGLPSDPFRRPVGIAPMAARHVLTHRGV